MRLKDFLNEKVDQLVHVDYTSHRGTVQYTMTLRKVGKDGDNRPIFVGNCLITDPADEDFSNNTFCAAIFRPDGTLLAMHHGDTLAEVTEAAGIVIATQRKAYGPNLRDHKKDWMTFTSVNTTVRGLNLNKL